MEHHDRYHFPLFPLLMKLDGEKVVVVGGGAIAERKAGSLLECGADVTVISPRVKGGLAGLLNHPRLHHIDRLYRPGDLEGSVLAVVAINDRAAGEFIANDARKLNIPVNVVDRPELCTFIVPAVVRRGRLTMAVSTGGASPAWSRHIKRRLAEEFGEEYTRLFDALASVRQACMNNISDPELRRKIFLKLADDSLLDRARSQTTESFEESLMKLVTQWAEEHSRDQSPG
jgi:precorrin-2 dehydrogenase/sirohydrochlorin ferrochelatase